MFNKYKVEQSYWERKTLLEIAVELHMANMGSFPDLYGDEYEAGLNNLKKRLAEWKSTDTYGNPDFDSAVRLVIEILIVECELMKVDPEYLIKRRRISNE